MITITFPDGEVFEDSEDFPLETIEDAAAFIMECDDVPHTVLIVGENGAHVEYEVANAIWDYYCDGDRDTWERMSDFVQHYTESPAPSRDQREADRFDREWGTR